MTEEKVLTPEYLRGLDMSRTVPTKVYHSRSRDQQVPILEQPRSSVCDACHDPLNPAQILKEGHSPSFKVSQAGQTEIVKRDESAARDVSQVDGLSPKEEAVRKENYDLPKEVGTDAELGKKCAVSPASAATSVLCYLSGGEDVDDKDHQQQLQHIQKHAVVPVLGDPPEALLRLDSMSMPNVSPDSGIQSIAGSPSGNDSPGSVTSVSTGEPSGEPTMQLQAPPQQIHFSEQQRHAGQPSPSLPEVESATTSCETILGEVESKSPGRNISETSDRDSDTEMTEITMPLKAPPMGRRKRGRPPKRKKSQFLLHKKSTIYSNIYCSDKNVANEEASVCAEDATPLTVAKLEKSVNVVGKKADKSEEVVESQESSSQSILDEHPDLSESQRSPTKVSSHSQVNTLPEELCSSDSNPGKGLRVSDVKKRGRGRPKGSGKKHFFTNVKNRVQKSKNRQIQSSSSRLIRKYARKAEETLLAAGSREETPRQFFTEKRKRGRPRKNASDLAGKLHHERWLAKSPRHESNVRSVRGVGDSELASLIQSIQHSIHSQFQSTDVDESSEFTMDNSNDISIIEPSLPSSLPVEATAKKPGKTAHKFRKPKLHVMMRNPKRRKKKRLQQPQPKSESEFDSSLVAAKPVSLFRNAVSFKNTSWQPTGIFGASYSRSLGFFARYQPSKILKESSFSLHSSSLTSALSAHREDTSGDEDRDGSEGKKRKKKKKLLYFKSKHRNIIDPAFVAQLESLDSMMEGMTISEKAYIRVKPGEVPLPSIFKLTIIDVKKKKKDRLILEPPVTSDKTKKAKQRKDSRDREPAMPELTKEKMKTIRKKSQSDDSRPPNLEIQLAREQCLPPKKRHKMMKMFATEVSDTQMTVLSEPYPPEKRKVGRPRKNQALGKSH